MQVEQMMRSVDAMRIERDLLLSQQSGQQSEQERIATLEQVCSDHFPEASTRYCHEVVHFKPRSKASR